MGATGLQSLNGCTSLSRGTVQDFEIHSEYPLEKLTVMDLHSKAYLTIYNEWFCDKVCVETPEGNEVVFPCYRWLHPRKTMQITPAAATLVFQVGNSILQRLRMSLLENAQKTFRSV
ncbi:hydroperoxide isomerase ALOXE3-like [Engraulis encrasicolus]|uniref:hydroperoxide isomerase ALOXE3-like n=1 Tax=Engraulis encrasicolus TaxID=184585 RepID=UPI002FD4EB4F